MRFLTVIFFVVVRRENRVFFVSTRVRLNVPRSGWPRPPGWPVALNGVKRHSNFEKLSARVSTETVESHQSVRAGISSPKA